MVKKAPNKKQLRSKADRLWYFKLIKNKCECCKNPANQVHHFFPKSNFGHLRYDLDNGISICNSCHFKLHFTGDPTIGQKIIENRGKKWFDSLKKKAYKKQPPSYMTIGWYKDAIDRLS